MTTETKDLKAAFVRRAQMINSYAIRDWTSIMEPGTDSKGTHPISEMKNVRSAGTHR